ncbi:class III lanthionine synthetase LanKC [Microbacterium immunditiarum]|uniref:non-specific serine/threonine protein kinase n=1 Tax=Microbacterium immunditiarum TaxID=337480 RepID=A0A7Y9GKG7_9MICO|nr:serine/threonine protein kinase [Microbacterium immunditiarum]
MDATYPRYAVADPLFYDEPSRAREAPHELFEPSDSATWATWSPADDGTWSFWMPPDATLPEQGWKIHVGATLATAGVVLEQVSLYCHRNGLPFKFLRDRRILQVTLSKDGDRHVTGKFITIYPLSPADLHSHLTELDAALAGMASPYVLTDLRWKQGPVFVRYGAFTRQFVNHDGADVLAVRDLDTGVLVPDVRATAFHVPPWVRIPDFLQIELDALGTTPPQGFPRIRGALQFSNAGGVYEAELEGRPVILKEARPHVGWTPDGRDAAERLRDEEALLQSLQGRVPVPAVQATFMAHDHAYLAMERIDAVSLSTAVAAHNPLVSSEHSLDVRRAYREWAFTVAASLRQAVAALHDTGRVHGDLHPGNILVRGDGTVILIDLEMSRPVDDGGSAVIGAPGFVATDGRDALGQDLYALACTELFMFVPLIPLLNLSARKVGELVCEAADRFDLGQRWVDDHVAVLRRRDTSAAVTVTAPATPSRIARTLLADATPERGDRLWPGDPAQFREPSTSLAHGALGVLTALSHARVRLAPQHLAWLEDAASRPGYPTRLGLLDGLAGAVWAYRRMGLHDAADRHLVRLSDANHDRLGFDLYGGQPGVGLTLLAEGGRHAGLRDVALGIAARIRERWRVSEPQSTVATGRGGLLHGATGSALFAMRLYEATGDAEHLRIATEAIDFDLCSLKESADGALHVDEGWRLLPYLGNGSAGMGIVLTQLLTHLPGHSRYLEALDGITRAAIAPFTIQSGLFQGRAGLIQSLLALEQAGLATPATSAALHHHISALQLHAVYVQDEIRFAGNGLLRASCDLATGAAGVLTTLIDYDAHVSGLPHQPVCVPYLTPFDGVEDHSPQPAARPSEGGENLGLPPVPAVARPC